MGIQCKYSHCHLLISAASVALLAVSCIQERQLLHSDDSSVSSTVTVSFSACDTDTKAAFGEFDSDTQRYPTFWTAADDKICLSMNMNDPVYGEVVKTEEVSRTADFIGTFEDTGAPYKFYALTPVSVVNGISESRGCWSVSIPAFQTPKSDGLSCDENAMLLFAESDELDSIPDTFVRMHLRHVPAYCRLALKNLDAAFASFGVSDPVVSAVDVSYSIPVAGDWYINVSDGSLEPKDASHTITIHTEVSDLGQPTDIWYALVPAVLDGQTVKVTVKSDKGYLSRTYTFGKRTYVAGTVNKLSLDMTKNSSFDATSYILEETVYELVTSPGQLSVGDQVIMMNDNSARMAMSQTFNSDSTFGSVNVDAADGFTYDANDGYVRLSDASKVMVWTIASHSGSAVIFHSQYGYMNTTGSGADVTFTQPSTTARSFTLYSFSSGKMGVYYSADGYFYSIYVYSSDRFKINCIASNTVSTISLFRKKDLTTIVSTDIDDDPILQKECYGAYLSSETTTHSPGITQMNREYMGESVQFSLINYTQNTVLEFCGIPVSALKGDSFDLTLRRAKGVKTLSTQTYHVTVAKEEGARLWLTDRQGNGFIVKR